MERLATPLRETPALVVTDAERDAAAALGVPVADAWPVSDAEDETLAAAFVPVGEVDAVCVWPFGRSGDADGDLLDVVVELAAPEALEHALSLAVAERAAVTDAVTLSDSDEHVVAVDDALALRCALALLVGEELGLEDAALLADAVADGAALALVLPDTVADKDAETDADAASEAPLLGVVDAETLPSAAERDGVTELVRLPVLLALEAADALTVSVARALAELVGVAVPQPLAGGVGDAAPVSLLEPDVV